MRKLQVLQNQALRLLLNKPRETPVRSLLSEANQMSVHQLVAYHTGCQTYKVYRNKEPIYHHERLFGSPTLLNTRSAANFETRVEHWSSTFHLAENLISTKLLTSGTVCLSA